MIYPFIKMILPYIAYAAIVAGASYVSAYKVRQEWAQETAVNKAIEAENYRHLTKANDTVRADYERFKNDTSKRGSDAIDKWVQVNTTDTSKPPSAACGNYVASSNALFAKYGESALRLANEAQSVADRLTAAQKYISEVCIK